MHPRCDILHGYQCSEVGVSNRLYQRHVSVSQCRIPSTYCSKKDSYHSPYMGCNPNAQGHPIIRASMYSYFWLSGENMKQMFLLAIDQMITVCGPVVLLAAFCLGYLILVPEDCK